MKDRIIEYINQLFAGAEFTVANAELREELLNDTLAHYDDMISVGMDEQVAYRRAVSQIGDVSALIKANNQTVSQDFKNSTYGSGVSANSTFDAQKFSKEMISGSNSQNNANNQSQDNADFFDTKASDNGVKKENSNLGDNNHSNNKAIVSNVLLAVAVLLYIFSIIPPIAWDNTFGTIMMFVFIGVATALIIMRGCFDSATKNKKFDKNQNTSTFSSETNSNETVANKKKSPLNKTLKVIKSIIDITLTAVSIIAYISISMVFSAWHIAWIVFIIAVALGEVSDGILELIGGCINEG